jgi:hypothetical protein
VIVIISWQELFDKTRGNCKIPERLLCLDPGETTGWAVFEKSKLVRWGQIRTVENEEILWHNVNELFQAYCPDFVVCEDYRIYAHKLARHSFSPVLTLRLIGGIDLMCNLGWYVLEDASVHGNIYERYTCPIHYQMATQAKGFVTDEKLQEWGFWQEGMRHSRDAIRHGCYFLLFHERGKDIV